MNSEKKNSIKSNPIRQVNWVVKTENKQTVEEAKGWNCAYLIWEEDS
jgi:hypothetical protein